MTELVLQYGLPGLALAAFLAATLLPFSSEAALLAALTAGLDPLQATAAASLGNVLACAFNYALGRSARERVEPRLQRSRAGRLATQWMEKYGAWSLALAWLPVVGDPLTLLAGVARIPLPRFAALVFTARVARYVLITWAFTHT